VNENDIKHRMFLSGLLAQLKTDLDAKIKEITQALRSTLSVEIKNEKVLTGPLTTLVVLMRELPRRIFRTRIENEGEYFKRLDKVSEAVRVLSLQLKDQFDIDREEDETESNSQKILFLELVEGLKDVEKAIKEMKMAQKEVTFPKVQQVSGDIKVTAMPPVEVKNQQELDTVEKLLADLILQVKNIRLEVPPAPKFPEITIPEYPKEIRLRDFDKIMSKFVEFSQKLDEFPQKMPRMEFPSSISVDNFPPQKIPQPVTNFNINPLRGDYFSSAHTVNTTPTKLPPVALSNRRSFIVFNNSSKTIYLGGEDVSVVNGLPLPGNSYSPPFDGGERMTLYGVVQTGTADVRVLEMSNEEIGG